MEEHDSHRQRIINIEKRDCKNCIYYYSLPEIDICINKDSIYFYQTPECDCIFYEE